MRGWKLALLVAVAIGVPLQAFAFLGMNAGATLQGPLPAWTKQLGSKGAPKTTNATSLTVDSSGNSYITGSTDGGFDGKALTGATDYFLTKYDSSGTKVWTLQRGVASKNLRAVGVAVDPSGNVIVAGNTDTGLDGKSQTGTLDFFVVKYDSTGARIWTQQLGVASSATGANAVTTDSSGNIFVAGYTNGGLDGNSLSSSGAFDFFVTQYNSAGVKQWTKQMGNAGSGGIVYAMAARTDPSGNVLVAGYTNNSIDGQPKTGSNDFFVTKYDASGNDLWTRQLGVSSASTKAFGVATDAFGNVFVTGDTTGSLDGNTLTGSDSTYITKYDSSGNKQWTKLLDVVSATIISSGITTDSSGNIFITGYTTDAIDGNTQTGSRDAFAVKYDTSGTRLWSEQLGAASAKSSGSSVATDSFGNILITGYSRGNLDGNTITGIQDLFLTKYSSSGSKLWTKENGSVTGSAGTVSNAFAATDASGNLYTAGTTNSGLDGNTLTGTNDFFVTKYTSSGARLWTKELGVATKDTLGNGVATDPSGNIYVTGDTYGGLNGNTLTGLTDFFLTKYNSTGAKLWTKQLGVASAYTHGTAVITDVSGNVFVAGSTGGGLDGNTLSGSSNTDFFVTKYNSSGTKLWTKQMGPSGTSHYAYGIGVAADLSGNVFVAGYTNAQVDGQPQTGFSDIFITKYDSSGAKQWTRQLGASSATSTTYGAATDPSGNVFVTGSTNGGLDGNTRTGNADLFVVKYDGAGSKQWTRQLGVATKYTEGDSITTDSFGNVFASGYTSGGLDGNVLSGSSDFFVTKYTSTGLKQWTKELGVTSKSTYNYGIAMSPLGQLYITGTTNGGLDNNALTGATDFFVSQYIGN